MSDTNVYFSAELRPNHSLSRRGFNIVMLLLGGASIVMGVVFLSLGFFPVVGFLGLDVLLLWLAFRASFRGQKRRTYIQVTSDDLAIRDVDSYGRAQEFRFPTFFTRVALPDQRAGASGVDLSSSGRKARIGGFLNEAECRELAERLRSALAQARISEPP